MTTIPPYPRVEKHEPMFANDYDDDVCIICMEGGNVVYPCSCVAAMHRACWTKWKASSGTNECPFCRQERGTPVPQPTGQVPEFSVGQRVLYREHVVTVESIDTMYTPPSYVIRFDDGRTRDTEEDRLRALAPSMDDTPTPRPSPAPRQPPSPRQPSPPPVYDNVEPYCRFCGSDSGQMQFRVCGCRDPTMQWAHQACVERVIESHGDRCLTCMTKFKRSPWKKLKRWARRHKKVIKKILLVGGTVVTVIIVLFVLL